MKKKLQITLAILVGIGVGGLMTSCGTSAVAKEPDYMKYCGRQTVFDDKTVEVYLDTKNNKLVYVASDGFQHPISIAVVNP